MPLTVRKFNAQIKDPDSGQMIPAGLLSSDSLQAIEAAETSAVTEIQQKGAETKASIPDDYTELSESVDELKESIKNDEIGNRVKKEVSGTVVKLFEPDISNVAFETDDAMTICGINRFNIADAVFTHNSAASTVITKTETGITVTHSATPNTYKRVSTTYVAEYDGDLWLSCVASTEGYVRVLRFVVYLNGNECGTCTGPGLLKQKITVEAGDTVEMRFYCSYDLQEVEIVSYNDIMISYTDSDFVPFSDTTNVSYNVISHDLPKEAGGWTVGTVVSGVSGLRLIAYANGEYTIYDGIPKPIDNNHTPVGLSVEGADLVPYNGTFNGNEGVGVSDAGRIAIYVAGCATKNDYIAWFSTHTVTIKYDGTEQIITPYNAESRKFASGEIISFAETTEVVYYYNPAEVKAHTKKMVSFGDSITGMFGFGTDYPSMISDASVIDAINCGFSGSTWTDYGEGNYMPFSINRLIDSVVAEDFSLQDNVIGSITTKFYAEHLANLKAVNWEDVEYVTFLAGVNDWYYALHPLYSADDEGTENKQRTNVQDCVKYCISQLLTKYPHLKIIVITPYHAFMQNVDSDTTPNTNGKYLYQYADVIKDSTLSQRMPCVELYYTSGVNQITMYYYTSDGTHPNEAMKHMIAKRIIKCAETISEENTLFV